MKKIFKYLLIFLLPLLILDAMLILRHGFGGFSDLFIVEDLNSQYMSLIRWLQDVLHGSENLFYSFSPLRMFKNKKTRRLLPSRFVRRLFSCCIPFP